MSNQNLSISIFGAEAAPRYGTLFTESLCEIAINLRVPFTPVRIVGVLSGKEVTYGFRCMASLDVIAATLRVPIGRSIRGSRCAGRLVCRAAARKARNTR